MSGRGLRLVHLQKVGLGHEHFAANLGIEDLRYAVTVHTGGASCVTGLQAAALAIASGIATNVLVPMGWLGYSAMRVSTSGRREGGGGGGGGGPLGTTIGEWYLPYGASVPVQGYAWIATRHMQALHEIGGARE